ncbi:uncharacterized protein EI90DRAFT_3141504 [Cantharellus anzutake]|uniref:uncharacterized protein n=1 Tax=Cantharellus anzutake TaxID=1750568 RepID=UPI001906AF8A|nr:uncharacterized protein EI90DRAFT_3141504 [Cantharellus anzutake]KAF8308654.1 hypothetical protein EI90DRAFT_3141504 [Cantharellus anzutake]
MTPLYLSKLFPWAFIGSGENIKLHGVHDESMMTSVSGIAAYFGKVKSLVTLVRFIHQNPGPVSFVLITQKQPSSSGYRKLAKRVRKMKRNRLRSPSRHRVHVQLLSSPSVPLNQTHNAHLNMARFFAATSAVVFFPDGISSPAPPHLYETLSEIAAELAYPIIIEPTLRRPVKSSHNLGTRGEGSDGFFSYNSLLYIPRNASVWCPERFFIASPLEWSECLWFTWLKHPQSLRSPTLDKIYEAMSSYGPQSLANNDDAEYHHPVLPRSEPKPTIQSYERAVPLGSLRNGCQRTTRPGGLDPGSRPEPSQQVRLFENVQHVKAMCSSVLRAWGKYLLSD